MTTDAVTGATALWRRLIDEVDFFGTHGAPMPEDAYLDKALRDGALLLPQAYTQAYVEPVQRGTPQLLALARAGRIRMSSVEIVTGGITQHGPGWPMTPELRRFVAVVSNLYRSFLDSARRADAGMPDRGATLPPLAAFQHRGDDGPITITVDLIAKFLGGGVGVVGLPATFAAHPILWTALAHETGGHDVTHADTGLLEEFAAGLPGALRDVEADVGLPAGQLAAIWGHWIDEAVADVYGLLNAGPAFVENSAVVLAAMGGKATGALHPSLRMECRDDGRGTLDAHPADILRLHVALGAIDTLAGLSSRRAATARISALAEAWGVGSTVTLAGAVPIGPQRALHLDHALPREAMARAAEAVGRHIASATMITLDHKPIQAIETWDDEDEARVSIIRDALAAGRPSSGLGDDAQLLAAATAAAIEDASNYPAITASLNDALDFSFETDPVWRIADADRMYIRYPTRP